VTKGTHPDTEHFGAFEAQVPIENMTMTQYNLRLQQTLEKYDVVYLAGQAKSHCVANTLKQVVRKAPNLAKKFVVLEDAMSNVAGGPAGPTATNPTFEDLAQPIYDEAKALGVKFSTTVTENLNARSGAPVAV
jgi:nicotinamidase-related amidase